MRYLDLEKWKRRDHFFNFLNFQQPFFNITAQVDVTDLKRLCKERKLSFFISYYYVALRIINELEAFRYRIREDKVIVHDKIHGGCAILNGDETFSFAYYDYHKDFGKYYEGASAELQQLKENPTLDPQFHRDDLIHASVIPWVAFSSFEHAKRLNAGDSTPKVVFGKLVEQNGRALMPICVAVHHSLADGIDVGKFFMRYQALADKPEDFFDGSMNNPHNSSYPKNGL